MEGQSKESKPFNHQAALLPVSKSGRRNFRFTTLTMLLAACVLATGESEAATDAKANLDARHRALLQKNCEGCHGAEKQKGKFRLDDLSFSLSDNSTADRWQKILNVLNAGEMPPEEKKPIPAAQKTEFLDELSNTLVAARRSLSDQRGVITMRRLNRREYANTLRTLLGADIHVSELPGDTMAPGPEVVFDTVGSNLFMSSNQIEQYLSLAKDALEDAFERHASRSIEKKLHVEAEESLAGIQKEIASQFDGYKQFHRWSKAVAEAAAKPENQPIAAEFAKKKADDAFLRKNWEKISGAPSPEEFGFERKRELLNSGAVAAERAEVFDKNSRFHPYYNAYLAMPKLDTGSYFTAPVFLGAPNSIIFALKSRYYISIPQNWPAGDYVVRFRVAATENATPEDRFLEVGIGRSFQTAEWMATSTHHVDGTMESPQVFEVPVSIRKTSDANDRTFFIRQKGAYYRHEPSTAKQRNQEKFDAALKRNGFGLEFPLWLDWMEVERKVPSEREIPPGIKALNDIFFDEKSAPPTEEILRDALGRFAKEAFRGTPVRPAYIDRLVGMYRGYRAEGKLHGAALKETLAIVLSSPPFLYLAEPVSDGIRRPLTQQELATRLSYFLWGTAPDASLQNLAEQGALSKPEVLLVETDRLLNDERSLGFLRPFFQQWLVLDRLDFFKFSRKLFPDFDDGTELAARKEIFETLSHLLRTNASLSDLLKSDYVVVNNVLAEYYGIPGVKGDHFQKVPLPSDSPRGGLIGMAAILAMGGNGEHTSPVERGAWVLRKLLNDPPPPAPPNIPQLNRLAEKVLTPRERVLAHQEEPQCASCHRKIDPVGFGLENFDAVGQWRTEDHYQAMSTTGKPIPKAFKTWSINPAGALHKGPAFRDFFELRDILASRSNSFARGFSSALIQYALGRPCGFSDEPLLDAMVEQASGKTFAVREFIYALVSSKEFHSK
ncbi:MAG: Protein of unknown function DUF1592/DUF1588/DUF1585/DUF1587/DUF1595/Planctomycete cytochrome C [Verrucomicrobia bacterium]|nr:MAG: Protein of unknown function DUF1592/DUF1588/DUF1585/DUF1587/DUF1595/Planctomycete cytochrome C [Verrucomicrobiota bacterium]